jgi:hypothetical protein
MSGSDMSAELAELRALAAAATGEAATLATRIADITTTLTGPEYIAAARRAGYAAALAEQHDYQAAVRAQQARAAFRGLPGGAR